MTTLLPEGSRERTVPETVTGGPPGVNVWDPTIGGICRLVERDEALGFCVGVFSGWTEAGLGVAGSPDAGFELAAGAGVFEGSAGADCGVLEGSTGGAGFEVASGCGSGVLDESAGGGGFVVG